MYADYNGEEYVKRVTIGIVILPPLIIVIYKSEDVTEPSDGQIQEAKDAAE